MDNITNKHTKSLFLVSLMVLSVLLPGCIESTPAEDEDVNPNSAPVEAMGMWWPTVDGIIGIPILSGHSEWSDAHKIDINFEDDSGSLHGAKLTYKSVEEGMALALEIDGLKDKPQSIIVEFPDREISLNIDSTESEFVPSLTIGSDSFDFFTLRPGFEDSLGKDNIAAIYDLDSNDLVVEVTAEDLFSNSTEVSYALKLEFENTTWQFDKTTIFDWVLPYLFPRNDISIQGIEVIQTIQTADMAIPLIEGKKSLARVYVDSRNFSTAEVTVTLKLCILIFCVDQLEKNHLAVKNPNRDNFDHSANFVLPDHWVTFEGYTEAIPIGLVAKITPNYEDGIITYLDPNKSNNNFMEVITLNPTHDLSILVLPTREWVTWDGSDDPAIRNEATMEYWMDTTEAAFPVGNLDVTYLSPILSPDLSNASAVEVNNWLRTLDAFLSTGLDYDQMFGARSSSRGGLSDPLWSSSGVGLSRVSSCGDAGSTSRQLCAAHEIIHNIGPSNFDGDGDGFDGSDSSDEDWGTHLQCRTGGSGSGDDAVWRNLFGTSDINANIQDLGWDSNVPLPETNNLALIPSAYPDLMSYCRAGNGGPADTGNTPTSGNDANTGAPWNLPYVTNQTKWMSTYHYLYLYDQLSDWDTSNPPYLDFYSSTSGSSSDGRQMAPIRTIRVVSGMADDNGANPTLSHSWESEGVLPTGSNYQGSYVGRPHIGHSHDNHGDDRGNGAQGDDEGPDQRTFHCSSTVGGTPDTEIPFSEVNDGKRDCGDGSDEPQDFDNDGTIDNWFDCMDGSTVSMELVNDGNDDCPDGDDESHDNSSDSDSEPMYTIRVLDNSGNVLDSAQYTPNFEVHESNETTDDFFTFYFQDNGMINSIEIIENSTGRLIDSKQSSGQPTTRMSSLDATEFSREEIVDVKWSQATSSSNNDVLYQLEYSWGNDLWLPIGGMTSSTSKSFNLDTLPGGTSDSKFRVRATNGFDTYFSESSTFRIPNQAPTLNLETSEYGRLAEELTESTAQAKVRIHQGESFSITPEIRDDDWTPINENGCTAVLKRGQETVWSDGNTINTAGVREKNRISSHPSQSLHNPHDSANCLHNDGKLLPYSFPNKDLLPGEMTPGDYEFVMTYIDVGGASVSEKITFTIIDSAYLEPINSDKLLTNYRTNLEKADMIDWGEVKLSKSELQYYVELQRAARSEDGSLSDTDLNDLVLSLGISDSRAEEVRSSSLRAQGGGY